MRIIEINGHNIDLSLIRWIEPVSIKESNLLHASYGFTTYGFDVVPKIGKPIEFRKTISYKNIFDKEESNKYDSKVNEVFGELTAIHDCIVAEWTRGRSRVILKDLLKNNYDSKKA